MAGPNASVTLTWKAPGPADTPQCWFLLNTQIFF